MKVFLNPEINKEILPPLPFTVTNETIQKEQGLFGASVSFLQKQYPESKIAYEITRLLMGKESFGHLVYAQAMRGYHPMIDTRVTMLMPGWYACIPGWHCDGVIRKKTGTQPDLNTINEPIYHYVVSYSGIENSDIAPTQFYKNEVEADLDETAVWKSLDRVINAQIETEGLKFVHTSKDGELVTMIRETPHRGTPAIETGWRFFYRMSFYHMPAQNQIRNQTMVYVDKEAGW